MSLTVCTANYTAVLDALTAETYILVITRGNVRKSDLHFDAQPSIPRRHPRRHVTDAEDFRLY